MFNLFGKRSSATAKSAGAAANISTVPRDAICKLKDMISELEKKEKHIQRKIDIEISIAREHATKNKRAAMMALRKKRLFETELEKIADTKATLETQVMTIENAHINLEVMNAMKAGSDAMKSIHGAININKVDSTMDDIRDQMDLASEISSAISQPLGLQCDYDEDELAAELAEMQQEQIDSKLLSVPSGVQRPLPLSSTAAPGSGDSSKHVSNDEDTDELEQLRASMSI